MPALYHKGAKRAFRKGRGPAYSTDEPVSVQRERERMLREQIRRREPELLTPKELKEIEKRKKKWPEAWSKTYARKPMKLSDVERT